jgi:hypothetical protein
MNTTSNTHFQINYQVGQNHVATGVLLVLETNTQPSEPKLTNTQRKLAWLAACGTPVRPMAHAGQTGDTCQTGGKKRSGRWLQQPHKKCSREP